MNKKLLLFGLVFLLIISGVSAEKVWTNLDDVDIGNWVGTAITVEGMASDNLGNIYMGFSGGKFGIYNKTTELLYDLSATDSGNWVSINNVYSLSFNSINDLVYTTVASGKFGSYNRTSNIWTDLSSVDTDNWVGTANMLDSCFYSGGNSIYIVGTTGKFGVYNVTSNVLTDLSSTDTDDWMGTLTFSAVACNEQGLVFTVASNGKFGVYNVTSNVLTDLSSTDTGNWAGTGTYRAIDSKDNLVFVGMDSGKFGVYNVTSNVLTDLSATDSANWVGSNRVNDVYIVSSESVYTAGLSGKFGRYNISSNAWLDLSSTDQGDWMNQSSVNALAYDSSSDLLYTGTLYTVAQQAIFGVYGDTVLPTTFTFGTPTDANNTYINRTYIQVNGTIAGDLYQNATVYLYNNAGTLNQSFYTNTTNLFANFTGLSEGVWTYNITLNNNDATTVQYGNYIVTIDTTNPVAAYVTPTETDASLLGRNYIQVNATCTDTNFANSTITLYKAGSPFATHNATTASHFYNFTTLDDDVYQFIVTCRDKVGQTGTTALYEVELDTTNPTISFVAPTTENNTIVYSGEIIVNITCSDANFQNSTINLYKNDVAEDSNFVETENNYVVFTGLTDDTYKVNATCYDSLGHSASTTTYNYTILSAYPIITFNPNSMASGLYDRTYVFVNVSVDDTDFANLTISLYDSEGALEGAEFSETANTTKNFTGLSEETYYLNVTAYDDMNHKAESETRTYILDLASPMAMFVSPTPMSGEITETNNLIVNITCSDPNYSNSTITVWKDSVEYDTQFSATTNNELSLTGLTDGEYTYEGLCFDLLNHNGSTGTQYYTVDTTNPTLVFNPNSNRNGAYDQDYLWINVTATDANFHNITAILMEGAAVINTTFSLNETGEFNFTSLSDGVYQLYLTAYDVLGHSYSPDMEEFIIDSMAPVVSYGGGMLVDGSYTNQNTIYINVTCSENNVDTLEISIYDSGANLVDSASTSSDALEHTSIALADGEYTYSATCTDVLAKSDTTTVETITIDTTNPVVTFIGATPDEDEYVNTDSITFELSIVEDNYYNRTTTLYKSGIANGTSTSLTDTFSSLDDGYYSLISTSCDLAGNCASSEERNFTIATYAITFHALDVVTSAAILTFNVTFSDDNGERFYSTTDWGAEAYILEGQTTDVTFRSAGYFPITYEVTPAVEYTAYMSNTNIKFTARQKITNFPVAVNISYNTSTSKSCYQTFTNTSNSCGGVQSIYTDYYTGTPSNPVNANDGNYSTYMGTSGDTWFYKTYAKPAFYNGAIVDYQIGGGTRTNTTLPSSCSSNNYIYLRARLDHGATNSYVECYNSTASWQQIASQTTYSRLYEMNIWWNITGSNYFSNDTTVAISPGTYTVAAYADEYLIKTQQASIVALQDETIVISNMTNAEATFVVRAVSTNGSAVIDGFNLTLTNRQYNYNETFVVPSGNTTTINLTRNIPYNLTLIRAGYANQVYNLATNISHRNQTINLDLFSLNSIRIYVYDEATSALITSVFTNIELIGAYASYNYTINGTTYLDGLVAQEYNIRYSASGYDTRSSFFVLNDGTTNSVSLFLAPTNSTTQIIGKVVDTSGRNIQGARIKALKYFVETNSFQLVQTATTDFSGEAILDVYFNSEFYIFIIEYPSGTVRLTSSAAYIINTEIRFVISLGEVIGNEYFELYDTSTSLTFNEINNSFVFTWNNADNNDVEGCLEVYIYEDDEINLYGEVECIDQDTAAGRIYFNVSNSSGSAYIAKAYIDNGDNKYLANQLYWSFPEIPAGSSSARLFWLGIVTIGVVLLAAFFNPIAALIALPIPAISFMLMGIIENSPAMVGGVTGLTVVCLILAVFIGRKA